VTLVDDVVEDVGRVRGAGEVAELVDDEDVGLDVAGEGFPESRLVARPREVVDECGGGREASVEAVLDGLVGDRDGEVGLAATRLADEDQVKCTGFSGDRFA